MRKVLFFVFSLFLLGGVFASSSCDLRVSLLNQEPYPAVPGDYVKIVFSVSGIQSNDCGEVSLQLIEKYPLIFDPGFNPIKTIDSGTFARGFSSNWIVPYRVRIDKDALDGSSEIDVAYSTKGQKDFKITKTFSIRIEEVKADFDVFVKNYDYSTKRLTLEMINLGKKDVYSLTLTIPEQENIKILGGNKNIVGDLDSKDYTSTDFYAIPNDGKIKVLIEYIDSIGEKRSLEKEIEFNSSFFEHTKKNGKDNKVWIIVGVAVLVFVILLIYRKKKRKKFF
ncbi:MAG: hypothetical protein QXX68_01310 [Candidatus Pacearchaeota archaeon]